LLDDPRFLILSILDLLSDILVLIIDFGDLLLLINDFIESVFDITAVTSNFLLSDDPQCLNSPIFFGEISTINLLVPSLVFLGFSSLGLNASS